MTADSGQAGRVASAPHRDRLTMTAVFLLAGCLGGYVAGCALHDPDTCWLVGLGRWIVEHGRLPGTDPFSYTYALVWGERPIVLYQWLTELVFYLSVAASGLTGVLALTAAVLALAFLALPMKFLLSAGVAPGAAAGLTGLGALAASFHFLARPEIFSYLCLALCIDVLLAWSGGCVGRGKAESGIARRDPPVHTGSRNASGKARWWLSARLTPVIVLWSNLHSGFVIGLLFLLVYLLCVAVKSPAASAAPENKVAGVADAVVLAFLASFATPYTMQLWEYLPRLFFPGFNAYIVELGPVGLTELTEWTYWPFLVLSGIGAVTVARKWKDGRGVPDGWFAVLCVVSAVATGAGCRRLIPFAVLLLLAGIAFLRRSGSGDPRATAGGDQADAARVVSRPVLIWPATVAAFAAYGAVLMALWVVPPQLPQDSIAFHPPFQAIEHLKRNLPKGRMLNDPQFGDVMIWHMQPCPSLFIDSRYDMYGDKLVADYRTMALCLDNWKDLLDRYEIAWLFLPPGAELAKRLSVDEAWWEQYRDARAVVLVKRGASVAR